MILGSEAGAAPLILQLKPVCTNSLGSLPTAVFYAAELSIELGGRHEEQEKKEKERKEQET